jgi:hypothetical protein
MKAGSIAVLFALLLIIGASVGYVYIGLTATDDPALEQGWIAMTFGMMIALFVGIGLVAFQFYSTWRSSYGGPMQLEDRD